MRAAEDGRNGGAGLYQGKITIRPTRREDLEDLRLLWNDGGVMKFVGFPEGLGATADAMERWYERVEHGRPALDHFSVFAIGIGYCGESFYRVDASHGDAAALDIKLFSKARGKGIAAAALRHAMERAFENGASCVWTDPNPENEKALALYRRLGLCERKTPAYLEADEMHGGCPALYFEMRREEFIPPEEAK